MRSARCSTRSGPRMAALDILINSAGGQFPQAAIDFSVKGWNTVINTNLNGTWYMMQAAAQRWRDHKHPGSIVNIVVVTTHGLYGIAHTVAARDRRDRAVARGCGRMGAAEHPGQLRGARRDRNRRLERLFAGGPRRLPRSNPMMRAGSPWDVAEASVFLAGPSGEIRHRRDADGGRRRPALGRDLDHGQAGVFRRRRQVTR